MALATHENINVSSVRRGMGFSARLVAITLSITLLVVIVAGLFSYFELRRMALGVAERTLETQLNALTGDLEERIGLLSENIHALAQNPLIANALADDVGRSVYLGAFMEGIKSAEGFPLAVGMTDFQGKIIAGNTVGMEATIPVSQIAELVEQTKRDILAIATDEDIELLFIEPIVYANTGAAEGALLYRVHLSDWMELDRVSHILQEGGWATSMSLDVLNGNGERHALTKGNTIKDDKRPTAQTRIDLPVGGDNLDLTLEITIHPDFINTPLRELVWNISLTGVVILILASFAILYLVRGQTAKLSRLRRETDQLTGLATDHVIHFTSEGRDEVDDLADSFNALVDDLRDAYGKLKELSEEKLRKSEERFRSIINASAESVVTISDRGIIETVNPATEDIFGYSTEELLGKSINTLLPERFHRAHEMYVQNSNLHSPRIINQMRELYGRRKNGDEFTLELTVSQLDLEGKNKFVGIMRDISDRKKAETDLIKARDELKRNEERFRSFAASTSDWYWEMDENLRFSYFSHRFTEVTGVPQEVLLGKTRQENGNPGTSEEAWQTHLDDLAAHRPFRNFIHPRTKPDGKVVWLSINGLPVFDENKKFKGYRGTGSDITKLHETQQGLIAAKNEAESANERFRLLYENSADAVMTLDEKGFLACNDTTLKMFGFKDESEFCTYHPSELSPPVQPNGENSMELASKKIKAALVEGVQSFEWVHLRKDTGETFPAEVLLSAKNIGEKGILQAVVRDISERKAAETALISAREEAEEASRAKSEFLSSMSHELRTPLNAILGFGQLLASDDLELEQKESIEEILKAGQHLLGLINDVLDLARIESGNLSIAIEDVYPSTPLEQCLNMAKSMAKKTGITVEGGPFPENLPPILTDQTRFKQVLLNFLSNAVKYNKERGHVKLSAAIMDNGRMRFSVSDTGIGIPKEKQKGLFVAFSRLGMEGSKIEGTGIGLIITKELVELMGGAVGYHSKPGEGSTFWFEIPLANGKAGKLGDDKSLAGEAAAAVRRGVNVGNGKKILYVEDNEANLALVQKIIKRISGLTLISAITGEEGIKLARREHPDLILMDINLPGMNGIDALHALRAESETRDIPVIAVSAAAMTQDIKRGKDAGFVEYLTKPIQVKETLDVIERVLNQPA